MYQGRRDQMDLRSKHPLATIPMVPMKKILNPAFKQLGGFIVDVCQEFDKMENVMRQHLHVWLLDLFGNKNYDATLESMRKGCYSAVKPKKEKSRKRSTNQDLLAPQQDNVLAEIFTRVHGNLLSIARTR